MSVMSLFLLLIAFLFIDVDLESFSTLTYSSVGFVLIKQRRLGNVSVNLRNKRFFSSSSTTEPIRPKEPGSNEKLSPIVLPEFDLTSIIYSFIVNSLLFALLIREKFLIALGIILGYFCVSFIYYF